MFRETWADLMLLKASVLPLDLAKFASFPEAHLLVRYACRHIQDEEHSNIILAQISSLHASDIPLNQTATKS